MKERLIDANIPISNSCSVGNRASLGCNKSLSSCAVFKLFKNCAFSSNLVCNWVLKEEKYHCYCEIERGGTTHFQCTECKEKESPSSVKTYGKKALIAIVHVQSIKNANRVAETACPNPHNFEPLLWIPTTGLGNILYFFLGSITLDLSFQ